MKKNLTLTKLVLIALVALMPLTFYAQNKQAKPVEKYFYISAEGGLSINHTDLANYGFVPFYQQGAFVLNDGYVFKNFDGQLGLGYQLGKVIGLNAKFGMGTLGGEKHNQLLTPNGGALDYVSLQLDKTKFMEANLNLTFNLTNLFFGYNPRRVFNFIPHIGIGGIRYTAGQVNQLPVLTTASGGAPGTLLLPAQTAAEMTYTVPVGAELNFNVAPKLDIYLDYTFTWAGNDKLDQVEKVFYTNSGRTIDDIQVINDMYSHLNLGLRFKFNNPCDIDKMARNANQITMKAVPDPLVEKDGKVCFDVVFTVPAGYFEKQAVMNVTPTINYKGGQIDLDPVTFVGEKGKGGDFTVNYKKGGEFTKNYCVDYRPEMENSTLNANTMFYVYDGTIYPTQEEIMKNVYFAQGGERKLADGVVVPVVKCEVSNIRATVQDNSMIVVTWEGDAESYDIYVTKEGAPAEDAVPTVAGVTGNKYTFTDLGEGKFNIFVKANCKNDNIGKWQPGPMAEIIPVREPDLIFFFDYQSATLKPNAKLNKDAIKALAARLVSGEPITGFEIEGYASPENGDQNNNKLSADRAKAAMDAIKGQLKKAKLNEKNFTFDTQGFGSDWETFEELVQNSNMKDKDQILRVIKNASNKEQEIQNMKRVYPELEKEILPQIRRAEVYFK